MDTNLIKKFIQQNINRLHEFEKTGEFLSSYELGKLNALDQILMLIDALEHNKK